MARTQAPLIYRGDDPGQARYNEEVGLAIRALVEGPLAHYSVIEVDVETTPTKVKHLLGKPYRGWLVVDRGNEYPIYRVDGPSTDPENASTHFYLQSATAAVTAQILVF